LPIRRCRSDVGYRGSRPSNLEQWFNLMDRSETALVGPRSKLRLSPLPVQSPLQPKIRKPPRRSVSQEGRRRSISQPILPAPSQWAKVRGAVQLLGVTNQLYRDVQASSKKAKEISESQLELMIDTTADAQLALQQYVGKIIRELEAERKETSAARAMLRSTKDLLKVSLDTKACWDTRPEMWQEPDHCMEALQLQIEAGQHCIDILQKQSEMLDLQHEQGDQLREALSLALSNKMQGLRVDLAAASLIVQPATPGDDLPSEMDHEAWLAVTMDLVAQASSWLKNTRKLRKYGEALRHQRFQQEKSASLGCLDVFHFRQAEWHACIKQQQKEIASMSEDDRRHSNILAEGMVEYQALEHARLNVEARLRMRSLRVPEERKSDPAEQSLRAELSDLQNHQTAVQQHIQEVEESHRNLQEELAALRKAHADSEASKEIDAACLKLCTRRYHSL